MSDEIPAAGTFGPSIRFWCNIWQQQIEQSFRVWGYWAQFLPHDSAARLAAEAEAMKPVVRTAPANRAPAAAAPVPKPAPAHKAPRTPVTAKVRTAAAKPTVH